MGRYTPLERAFLGCSFLVIGLLALFGLLRHPPTFDEGPATPDPAPAPPAAAPRTVVYRVRGNARDLPGRPPNAALLHATRVTLRAGDQVLKSDSLSADGSFRLDAEGPESGVRLRVTTRLVLTPFDRILDRDVWSEWPVKPSEAFLPELDLPRSEDFGEIRGSVVGLSGAELSPLSLLLDPVEGTSTPNVGIARGEIGLPDAANAPAEYRSGGRFRILHVPPGTYELRARVLGRLTVPARVTVAAGQAAEAVISEHAASRRFRGNVRDALRRRPLGETELTIASFDYSGPATRDPLRVIGRTSLDGLFDLPVPDGLPPEGLRVSFTREGYRGTDVRLTAADFHEGVAKLDLELAPE